MYYYYSTSLNSTDFDLKWNWFSPTVDVGLFSIIILLTFVLKSLFKRGYSKHFVSTMVNKGKKKLKYFTKDFEI